MPIRFRCIHCDKLLAVGVRLAGSSLRCPVCNGQLKAPQPRGPRDKSPDSPPPSPPSSGADLEPTWWGDRPLLPLAPDLPASPPAANPLASLPGKGPTKGSDTPPSVPAAPARMSEEVGKAPPPAAPRSSAGRSARKKAARPRESLRSPGVLAAVIAAGLLAVVLTGIGVLVLSQRWARNPPATDSACHLETTAPDTRIATHSTQRKPDRPSTELVRRPNQRETGRATVAATGTRPKEQRPPTVAPADWPPPQVETPRPQGRKTPPRLAHLQQPERSFVLPRHRRISEDELRRQLEKATEIGLLRSADRSDDRWLVQLALVAQSEGRRVEIAPTLIRQRADLAGLPLEDDDDCRRDRRSAQRLEEASVALRSRLLEGGDVASVRGMDAGKLRQRLLAAGEERRKWQRPEAVAALRQILMAGNEGARALLVELLATIDGPEAGRALAQRALFDLSAPVRKQAVLALSKRPIDEYRQVLVDGFRYPWPAVADHAAEAVVALRLAEVVPDLLRLLDQPAPQLPSTRSGKDGYFVREVVRINQLRSCLMCHAPSLSSGDRLRCSVPPIDQPLAPTRQQGLFIRADVTYLRQDFSLLLAAKSPGKWPEQQRFDFLVRERPVAGPAQPAAEADAGTTSEYQQALFFALRGLTGLDPGATVAGWKKRFLPDVTLREVGSIRAPGGVALDREGRLVVSSKGERQLLREADDGDFIPLDLDGPARKLLAGACEGLATDSQGHLHVCATEKYQILRLDANLQQVRVRMQSTRDTRLQGPLHIAADRHGGMYITDPAPETLPGLTPENGAAYYLSPKGKVTPLKLLLSRPRGIALSPDGKTLYVTSENNLDVMAYPLEGPGLPGAPRVFCKLQSSKTWPRKGAEGLAVDAQGRLHVAGPLPAIEVFTAQGVRLGLIPVPEPARHCIVAGDEGRTLYVTTTDGLFRVSLEKSPQAPEKE